MAIPVIHSLPEKPEDWATFTVPEELIKRAYGAKTVVVLNDIVRNAGKADRRGNANPFAGGGNGVNGYANVVHTDFRAAKAVEKFDQRPKRRQYPHGKYMLINTWRAPTGGGAEPTHPAAAQPLRYSRAFGP